MARQFKPVRFFVMMAIAAFIVWRNGVLHSSRGSRPNGRRTGGLCHRRESWRASVARHKVTDGRRIEYDGSEAFQAGGHRHQQAWDLAFENGYTDGFKKTHSR